MERSTRQRTAIRAAIDAAGRPLSPQEVLEAARADVAELGIATVYRNLKALVAASEARLVVLPGSIPHYESTDHDHHHHFQCNDCLRVFDVHSCPGDMKDMVPSGFTVEDHDLTLYGRCSDCAPHAQASRDGGAAARKNA